MKTLIAKSPEIVNFCRKMTYKKVYYLRTRLYVIFLNHAVLKIISKKVILHSSLHWMPNELFDWRCTVHNSLWCRIRTKPIDLSMSIRMSRWLSVSKLRVPDDYNNNDNYSNYYDCSVTENEHFDTKYSQYSKCTNYHE